MAPGALQLRIEYRSICIFQICMLSWQLVVCVSVELIQFFPQKIKKGEIDEKDEYGGNEWKKWRAGGDGALKSLAR